MWKTSYGEIGQAWITATLYKLYPTGTIDAESVLPMSVDGYITDVLMLEAAVLLIRDREQCGWAEAAAILRESAAFGAAQFPDQDGDAAEDLWRELAAARKPQVQREEALWNAMIDDVQVKTERAEASLPSPHMQTDDLPFVLDEEGHEVYIVE